MAFESTLEMKNDIALISLTGELDDAELMTRLNDGVTKYLVED